MIRKTSTENDTRKIEVMGNEIVYTRKKDGKKHYVTYNKVLYDILIQERVSPFVNEGRLRFRIWKYPKKPYLYDLALACEMGFITDPDDFCDGLERFLLYKLAEHLDIDHADSNKFNDTLRNISLMDKSLNSSKHNIVARFKPPFIVNSAYCGGEYRVQMAFQGDKCMMQEILARFGLRCIIEDGGRAALHFVCPTAEDYVDCLRMLADKTYEWCSPDLTPRKHNCQHKDIPYWASNIQNTLRAQKVLSMMQREDFQIYQKSAWRTEPV